MGTKWEEGPSRFRLETGLGPILCSPCNATDLFVQTGSGDFPECMTVRDVDVYASVHVVRDAMGVWSIASNPYIKRKGCYKYGKDHLSLTYEAKVRGAILVAVTQWALENPEERERVANRAQRAACNHALISAEDNLKKAKEECAKAQAAFDEAKAAYDAAFRACKTPLD